MATFILVHGSWHGAWCWHRIVPLLTGKGHRVVTPDLPGHGDDPTPVAQITLPSYVEVIARTLPVPQQAPVILVGHSMAGIVITQAAEQWPLRIHGLVYLAAFLPADGQSLADLAQGEAESLIPPNSRPTADGLALTLREAALAEIFYADCPAEDLALARRRLVPEPIAPLFTPVRTTTGNFGRLPRAYVECRRDQALPLGRQRAMQAQLPCAPVTTLDTGHSPFFAAPQDLADVLAGLAKRWDRR